MTTATAPKPRQMVFCIECGEPFKSLSTSYVKRISGSYGAGYSWGSPLITSVYSERYNDEEDEYEEFELVQHKHRESSNYPMQTCPTCIKLEDAYDRSYRHYDDGYDHDY